MKKFIIQIPVSVHEDGGTALPFSSFVEFECSAPDNASSLDALNAFVINLRRFEDENRH